jgi:hypothetical protein
MRKAHVPYNGARGSCNVIYISVHRKGVVTPGPVVFKMKQDQVACEEDINDWSNIKTDISHLYSC